MLHPGKAPGSLSSQTRRLLLHKDLPAWKHRTSPRTKATWHDKQGGSLYIHTAGTPLKSSSMVCQISLRHEGDQIARQCQEVELTAGIDACCLPSQLGRTRTQWWRTYPMIASAQIRHTITSFRLCALRCSFDCAAQQEAFSRACCRRLRVQSTWVCHMTNAYVTLHAQTHSLKSQQSCQ